MSRIYKSCSGTTTVDLTVVPLFGQGGTSNCHCPVDSPPSGYTDTTGTYCYSTSELVVTPWPNNGFTYDYHVSWTITQNGVNVGSGDEDRSVTVPAMTGPQFFWDMLCFKRIKGTPNLGSYTDLLYTYTFSELSQKQIPVCNVDPTCTLTLSTSTVLPSVDGASDGQIIASFTSTSGSTAEYYINGTSVGVQGTGYTFTGLASDTYIIQIEQLGCWDTASVFLPDGEFRTGDFTVVSPTADGNIVATENPIMLNLSTWVNSFTPVAAVSVFEITGATVSGVTINFALDFPYIYNAEFLSKGYPDRSNYFLESVLKNQVGVVYGSNSLEEIATSLAEAIQKDAILSRLYYITNSGTTVTLEAKEYGSMYELDYTNVTITGGAITLTNTVPGVTEFDGQLSPNYSLYTELFVDDTIEYGDPVNLNNFKRILELELPFDNSNLHQFDLSSTLKNFVSTPKINFLFTGTTFLWDMITTYFCKYGEKYPLIPNSNTKKKRYKGQTDYGYAINASLPFESANRMNDYFGTSDIYFLNTAPNTKYSHRSAKEFLSFTIPSNYAYPLKVYGNVWNYDGTSTLDIPFFDVMSSGGTGNHGGVNCVSVGYADLGLSTYESSSKIRKVDIVIKQNTGSWVNYTEVKSYLLEIDEQPDNFNVAFLNSLGTYETYTFTGEVQESEDVERKTYQRPYPIATDGSADVGFQYNSIIDTEYTKTYTVNTGIIDANTYYYLQGLLQSNRIYRYDITHQNYLNIVSQTSMKSTNTNEYSIQIVFKETISENNVNM